MLFLAICPFSFLNPLTQPRYPFFFKELVKLGVGVLLCSNGIEPATGVYQTTRLSAFKTSHRLKPLDSVIRFQNILPSTSSKLC